MKRLFISLCLTFVLLITVSCVNKNVENHEQPTQLISSEMASLLNKNYIEKRSVIIDSIYSMKDANAIWYSLEELENYIAYAKKASKEKGVEIDGIRIYMGVYPDEEKYLEKAGMTTLFIVPTSDFKVSSGGISLQKSADSKDITGIDYLNYGSSGLPPEIIFPH